MPVSNYLPSSKISQPGVCTSTTRPASPYVGQAIFETDTNKTLYYYGTSWYPAWNTSWGIQSQQGSYASTAFSAGTALTVLSATFTAVPNRRYQISGRVGVQVTGTATTPNALWVAQTTLGVRTLAYRTSAITQYYCELFSGTVFCVASDLGVSSGAGTSVTIDLKWKCGASGGLNTDPDAYVGANSVPHQLAITDVGPA